MLRWAVVVFAWFLLLVFSLDKQNDIMTYQMKIERSKKVKKNLEEHNDQLMFLVSSIHSPTELLNKLTQDSYSHLVFPKEDEIIYLELKRDLQ